MKVKVVVEGVFPDDEPMPSPDEIDQIINTFADADETTYIGIYIDDTLVKTWQKPEDGQ